MGWVGVDFDGVLAYYDGWKDGGRPGAPIPAMVARVKAWITQGKDVRIMTARVSPEGGYSEESKRTADSKFVAEQRAMLEAWCQEHLGKVLPLTHCKDFDMEALWDDRAVQMIPNTGEVVEDLLKEKTRQLNAAYGLGAGIMRESANQYVEACRVAESLGKECTESLETFTRRICEELRNIRKGFPKIIQDIYTAGYEDAQEEKDCDAEGHEKVAQAREALGI
jgi:hypothetical protein